MNHFITHETDITPLRFYDECDSLDYLIAACAGVIGGLIDIFFVGSPLENSQLLQWTDHQVDAFVASFAQKNGWNPAGGGNPVSALERKFHVNYDQSTSFAVGGAVNLTPGNHHMKSLAHSPSILGLFFSVVNQFSGTSTFLDNGNLITVPAEGELVGGNVPAKLFCACVNWFGHLVSDVSGSSSAKGRGSGIVAPFYELFGLCRFGNFDGQTLSQLAVSAFEKGYEFRFSMTTAIPVIVSELLTRFLWAFRRHFQMGKPLAECIPDSRHDDLRVMLLISNGTLCLMDGLDAGVRMFLGGDWLTGFMRLNLVAWCRFFMLVLKEICIRVGFPALEQQLEAFRRTNEAVSHYLEELKSLDIALFESETKAWNVLIANLDAIQDEDVLNRTLKEICQSMNLSFADENQINAMLMNPEAYLNES